MPQQGSDRHDDRVPQCAVLPASENKDTQEQAENDADLRGEYALLAPKQRFIVLVERTGKGGPIAPVGVEECFAIGHRGCDPARGGIGRGVGPALVESLLRQPRPDHRRPQLRDGTDICHQLLVGSSEPSLASDVGFEEAGIGGHQVAPQPVFLVEHRCEGSRLGSDSKPAVLERRCKPHPAHGIRQHCHQARQTDERTEHDERTAQLVSQGAVLQH
jgi:hypothetical protein